MKMARLALVAQLALVHLPVDTCLLATNINSVLSDKFQLGFERQESNGFERQISNGFEW